jgi:hypothetical protein
MHQPRWSFLALVNYFLVVGKTARLDLIVNIPIWFAIHLHLFKIVFKNRSLRIAGCLSSGKRKITKSQKLHKGLNFSGKNNTA